ncbi:MAG: amidophosphoribosyltransferase, partial [Thermovirga sp.]|nr:amidophosphoribosyltransferase [Thermovirga sp.]
AKLDIDTLRSAVGADSLHYLSIGDLVSAIGLPPSDICTACFSGDYLDGGEDNGVDL